MKSIFDEIKESKEVATSEENADVMMIGNKITLEMSDELLNNLIEKVADIRTEIVD